MRKRRDTEGSTISFLDVISCGFGAIILLLMITESSAPVTLELSMNQERPLADLQQELFAVRGETEIVNSELNAKREQLSAYQQRLADAERRLELPVLGVIPSLGDEMPAAQWRPSGNGG